MLSNDECMQNENLFCYDGLKWLLLVINEQSCMYCIMWGSWCLDDLLRPWYTTVHHCTHLYTTVHHSSASQERSVLTLQSTAAGVRSVPQSRLSTDQWQIRLVKHLPAATPDPGRPLVAGWRQKLVLRVLSRTMRCLCLGSVLLCRQCTRTTTEELRVSSAGVSHYTPLYPLYSLSRHNPVISC